MLGVVLWSDASDRKAVIWCEDQGDLAFFDSAEDATADTVEFFDAGDLVQFEMEVMASMRRARNPKMVIEQAGSRLPQVLRERVNGSNRPKAVAQVIPFGRRMTSPARRNGVYEKARKKG